MKTTSSTKCSSHEYEVVIPQDEQPYERCKKCGHCYRETIMRFEL